MNTTQKLLVACVALLALLVVLGGTALYRAEQRSATSDTTLTMTKEAALTMTIEAVLASHAAICVAQFMKEPNSEEKLKAFGEVGSWQRAEVIEKGGWDKMPGQEKAGYAVARACAGGLESLIKK